MRVAHISIVHIPLDVRVFLKECRTLAAAGHDVHLLVRNPPAEVVDGVNFHAIPGLARKKRFWHALPHLPEVYRRARAVRADVYHLHDPHLIPVGIALKRAGAAVVYDSHEDAPKQAVSVDSARALAPRAQREIWSALEWLAFKHLDAFVAATPAIARRFPPARTAVVRNVPLLEEFASSLNGASLPYQERDARVIYAGGISAGRSIREMVDMVELLPADLGARLVIMGAFSKHRPELESEVRAKPGWSDVEYCGLRPRAEMVEQLVRSRVGLVLFHPLPNHFEAMPNKLFEYMAAGLPIVASDFPLWRDLLSRIGCGLLVDPMDPQSIAGAVEYLLRHPGEAEAMGRRGREAVEREFHWRGEGERLLALYDDLAESRSSARRRR
jgi:glycosyltransferase involved in cell wall biosynthesis